MHACMQYNNENYTRQKDIPRLHIASTQVQNVADTRSRGLVMALVGVGVSMSRILSSMERCRSFTSKRPNRWNKNENKSKNKMQMYNVMVCMMKETAAKCSKYSTGSLYQQRGLASICTVDMGGDMDRSSQSKIRSRPVVDSMYVCVCSRGQVAARADREVDSNV